MCKVWLIDICLSLCIIIIITLTTDPNVPTKDESDNGEATEHTRLLPDKPESGEATKHSGKMISTNQLDLPLQ